MISAYEERTESLTHDVNRERSVMWKNELAWEMGHLSYLL